MGCGNWVEEWVRGCGKWADEWVMGRGKWVEERGKTAKTVRSGERMREMG
jgi:hypothetical protein